MPRHRKNRAYTWELSTKTPAHKPQLCWGMPEFHGNIAYGDPLHLAVDLLYGNIERPQPTPLYSRELTRPHRKFYGDLSRIHRVSDRKYRLRGLITHPDGTVSGPEIYPEGDGRHFMTRHNSGDVTLRFDNEEYPYAHLYMKDATTPVMNVIKEIRGGKMKIQSVSIVDLENWWIRLVS